jgi:hypothetical protein
MKVKISNNPKAFTPYTVTFSINTAEESIRFHDKVAIQGITGGPHEFLGRVFNRHYKGDIGEYEGGDLET